jgi:acyl-CoA synthetase (AMP-forming)/AMP-acid ligase II
MRLTQPLHKARRERPTANACVFGHRRTSFQDLRERVARLAAGLRSVGVGAGDRVGMLALNSDRYLEYLYGTWWVGGVLNPVNIRWTPAEIAFALNDCDTRVLLVDDAFASSVAAIQRMSKCLATVIHVTDHPPSDGMIGYEALLDRVPPCEDAHRGEGDLAAILYTGGTTGNPKGVMLTHDNLALNALSVLAVTFRGFEPTALHCAPLFHVAGISFVVQLGLRMGRHVFMPTFDTRDALRLIESERVTETFMVPTMIHRLLHDPSFHLFDTSSLRNMLYGAAPIHVELQRRLQNALPHVGLVQLYGQTEAGPVVSALNPEQHRSDEGPPLRLESAGRAIAAVEVRIVDGDDRELPCGEIGEVCIRGAGTMLGYLNQPELTAATMRDGWLHSGDVGYLDADGYLFVVDRIKDMIISGGENVYSAEVEKALLRHADVSMCAVIGKPDEQWGERVHAVVVRTANGIATAAELIEHCRTLIAGYKCPRSIEFRDQLPTSAAGKLVKHQLRDTGRPSSLQDQ